MHIQRPKQYYENTTLTTRRTIKCVCAFYNVSVFRYIVHFQTIMLVRHYSSRNDYVKTNCVDTAALLRLQQPMFQRKWRKSSLDRSRFTTGGGTATRF